MPSFEPDRGTGILQYTLGQRCTWLTNMALMVSQSILHVSISLIKYTFNRCIHRSIVRLRDLAGIWLFELLILGRCRRLNESCMQGSYLVLCALVLLTAAPSLAHRGLRQAPQQQGPQQPPQLPAQLQAVGNTAKSFFQSAIQDVFSALEYSAGDQQKIASTPKPQPGARNGQFLPPCTL